MIGADVGCHHTVVDLSPKMLDMGFPDSPQVHERPMWVNLMCDLGMWKHMETPTFSGWRTAVAACRGRREGKEQAYISLAPTLRSLSVSGKSTRLIVRVAMCELAAVLVGARLYILYNSILNSATTLLHKYYTVVWLS